jgi:hypothetical protein
MKNGFKQKIFGTLPTEFQCAMLMNMPNEARGGHEQQLNMHLLAHCSALRSIIPSRFTAKFDVF